MTQTIVRVHSPKCFNPDYLFLVFASACAKADRVAADGYR